jgi:O-antigen/teichoic acid export membrane protein
MNETPGPGAARSKKADPNENEGPARGRRVLLVNVVAGTGAQAMTALAALWSVPQLLAAVGSAGYGAYAIASSLLGYFSIADLGLSNATLQRLAHARAANDASLFGTVVGTSALLLGSIGALLGAALAVFAVPIGHLLAGRSGDPAQIETAIAATRWCAIGALPTMLRPTVDAVVSVSEKLTRSYAVATLANLTRTVGAVLAVWRWPGATTPIVVLVVATTAQFVLLVPIAIVSTEGVRLRHLRATRTEMRSLLRVSIPLWLSSGATLLANQIDRPVVSALFGLEAVGRYSVAQDLANRLLLFPYILSRAFFPRLARQLSHERPEEHADTIRSYGILSLLVSAVPAAPLAVLGALVLTAWTARDLGDGSTVFAWLLVGVVANCASLAPFAVLQIRLHFRAIAVSYVFLLVLHVIGCSTLPRVLGMVGAALSWALAQGAATAILYGYVRRLYRVPIASDALRILVAAIALAACAWMARGWLPGHPVDVHASAFARLGPIAGVVLVWCLLGIAIALAFLRVGRRGNVWHLLSLKPDP